MSTIKINRAALEVIIIENIHELGSRAYIECDDEGNLFCNHYVTDDTIYHTILSLGGLGEYTDPEGRYNDDDDYDADAVADNLINDFANLLIELDDDYLKVELV